MRYNECLIDWLRFSIPEMTCADTIENLLGLDYFSFSQIKSSPFPTYDKKIIFASIEVHTSSQHKNVLVNLTGQGCRQYEEYMSAVDGWHWHEFIKTIIAQGAKVSRIDLALDIFDDSCPSVRTIQDYIKRGQLSSRSKTFNENNSGRILDGVLTGFTVYIGASPQMLRIYDKKAERKDNFDEIVLDVDNWIRWELQLGAKKAMHVAERIADATPLNVIMRGILGSHYSFKTQQKGKKDFNNKSRWSNMKWWDKFIEDMPKIPLRTMKAKTTMEHKEKWLRNGVSKSLAMQYETLMRAYGEDYANQHLLALLSYGNYKISNLDEAIIEQRVNELLGTEEY